MPKNKKIKATAEEIKRREDDLTASLDAKNLKDLQTRQPLIVDRIKALLEVGRTPEEIGYGIRDSNPQMWIESQYAESVARALQNEGTE